MTTIDEIRERWAKATPGPWHVVAASTGALSVECVDGPVAKIWEIPDEDIERDDAEAIAAAPSDIATLLAALDAERAARERAEANYRFMVERAADQKLDGYRELGARAADAENERDDARAQLAKVRGDLDTMIAVHDEVERERDEERHLATVRGEMLTKVEAEALDLRLQLAETQKDRYRFMSERDAERIRADGAETLLRDLERRYDRLHAAAERVVEARSKYGLSDAPGLAEAIDALRAALRGGQGEEVR